MHRPYVQQQGATRTTRNKLELFSHWGAGAPQTPPLSRPGGLGDWKGLGQPNKSLNCLFVPDENFPENVPFDTRGSKMVRDERIPGIVYSGSPPKTYSYASIQMLQ